LIRVTHYPDHSLRRRFRRARSAPRDTRPRARPRGGTDGWFPGPDRRQSRSTLFHMQQQYPLRTIRTAD